MQLSPGIFNLFFAYFVASLLPEIPESLTPDYDIEIVEAFDTFCMPFSYQKKC
jgi:hypothetical protein